MARLTDGRFRQPGLGLLLAPSAPSSEINAMETHAGVSYVVYVQPCKPCSQMTDLLFCTIAPFLFFLESIFPFLFLLSDFFPNLLDFVSSEHLLSAYGVRYFGLFASLVYCRASFRTASMRLG